MYSILQISETSDDPVFDLATLETVKADLDISGTDEDDSLSDRISRASKSLLATYNLVFPLGEAVETFRFETGESLRPSQPLMLSRYPVDEVESVTVDGAELGEDAYLIEPATGMLRRVDGGIWAGVVAVTYTAGFVLPDDAPQPLAAAMIEMVRDGRFASATSDPNAQIVQQVKHGDEEVTFQKSSAGSSSSLSQALLDDLRIYRRPTAV